MTDKLTFEVVHNHSQWDAEAIVQGWEDVVNHTGLGYVNLISGRPRHFKFSFLETNGHAFQMIPFGDTTVCRMPPPPKDAGSAMKELDRVLGDGSMAMTTNDMVSLYERIMRFLVDKEIVYPASGGRAFTYGEMSAMRAAAVKREFPEVKTLPESKEKKSARKKFARQVRLMEKRVAWTIRMEKDMSTFGWLMPHLKRVKASRDKLNPQLVAAQMDPLEFPKNQKLVEELKWLISEMEKNS